MRHRYWGKFLRCFGSILYYFGLISAIFFVIWLWPEASSTIMWIVVIVGISIVIISTIRRNYVMYKMGRCSKQDFFRKLVIDIAGIILVLIIAVLLAGLSASYISQNVGKAIESSNPGLGVPVGLFSGIIAAVLIGLGVGYLVRSIWVRLTKSICKT